MSETLVIRGGTVIDPSSGTFGAYDVIVSGNGICGIYPPGTAAGDRETDAAGCFVSPGFIDLHTHIFRTVRGMGLRPDTVGVEQGVTTVVDAGSAGERDFPDFVTDSVASSRSQVLAWLNVSSPGLAEGRSELADLNRLNMEKAWARIEQYREHIVGIKVRMSGSVIKESGLAPLAIAKAVAGRAGLPVMVHVGNAPPQLGDVLDMLDAGDVVTHAFHGKPGGILDANGELIPQAARALQRGVRFDVGHGSSSFSFVTMRRAKELGIHPSTISTDIYTENKERGPVYSLAQTMTKFLALGYSLERVVERVTWAPAKALGRADRIGTLRAGTIADLTIFQVAERAVKLTDAEGETIGFDRCIIPHTTIRAGEIYPCTI